MWSETFEIEGSGSRKSKQKLSKIHPKCLPGGLWAGLGRQPCCQRLPGAVPERLWEGPGLPKQIVVGSLGASWGEKWGDFTLPEAPREVLEGF